MASHTGYLVRIAWRDLWRNRRRTLLVGSAMLVSGFIMVFAIGMNSGLVDEMARTVTGSFLGHAQVQAQGYATHPNLEHALSGEQVRTVLPRLQDDPEVTQYTPRLATGGLMSRKVPDPQDEEDLSAYRDMTSEGAMLLGIDPVLERRITTLDQALVPDDPRSRCLHGCAAALAETYLEPDQRCLECCPEAMVEHAGQQCRRSCDDVCRDRCPDDDDPWCDEEACRERCRDYCEPARFLADEDPYAGQPNRGEIMLGVELAHVLRAGVGDRVAVTIGTADGRVHGAIYRVCGLLRLTQVELNRSMALTHRGPLSAGVNLPDGATSIVLSFTDFEGARAVASRVEKRLLEGPALGPVRVRAWSELVPDLETFIQLKLGGTYVLVLVFTLIVAVIVANVVTMAVLERTREYGVRLALGESAARLVWSVLLESVILALLFGGTGTGLGIALVEYYGSTGLDMGLGELETAGVMLTGILYPRTTVAGVLFPMASVLLFALVGTIYPALRIRRIRVMDALHFS